VVGDYRRHDAPDQDRPKEAWSPYARVAHGLAFGIPLLGLLTHGLLGSLVGLGTVGIIATSAPNWMHNNFIERAEGRWIVRCLENYYLKEVDRAQHEKKLKEQFENPSGLERIGAELGCIAVILLILGGITLWILGLLGVSVAVGTTSNSNGGLGGLIILIVCILPFYPFIRRIGRAQELQMLADEPRGGIKTQTLRDFAIFMETWEHRYPLFILSSVVAGIAASLIV
jgi:hypothetical protein